MTNALSRSKSAFFNQTSTPASRLNKPHPPLPNILNTPTSPPSVPFGCPTPCALHNHSYHAGGAGTPAAPPSSSGTVRSARSAFFDSRRIRKSKPSIDDEETYCVLSEEGVEILAKSAGEEEEEDFDVTMYSRSDTLSSVKKGSKALKRTPSLGNLLKTPSRLNLRKMPSKLKLFADTPSSVKSNATSIPEDSSFSNTSHNVPPVPQLVPHHISAATTPTSNKSSRFSKSFLRKAVFRDKTESLMSRSQIPFHDASEHPLPGTVASRVKAMEDTYRRSLIVQHEQPLNMADVLESTRSASVPLLDRSGTPSENVNATGKTPRNKWLNRLNIGKSSTRRRTRLELPAFQESPGLSEKVEQEIKRTSLEEAPTLLRELSRAEEAYSKPTLRVQIEPPPDQERERVQFASTHRHISTLATPAFENPPAFDRLSLAVSPRFVGDNHNHTFTFGSRRNSATSYFGVSTDSSQLGAPPQQALIASSPLSGDLHITHSPGRNATAVVDHLNASFREREAINDVIDGDITGRFSIFTYEEKIKVTTDRPKSDPIPLKNIAQATNELRDLLESFEDTFAYDAASLNTSIAPGTKHSYFASPAPPPRKPTPRKQAAEIPDDLQDLIDGAVQLNEVLRVTEVGYKNSDRPISEVSSFEGNATTAQDALKALAENTSETAPAAFDSALATFEWVAAPSIHVKAEPTVNDINKRDSFSYSTSSSRSSMDGFEDQQPIHPDCNGPRPSFDSGRSSFDEPLEDVSFHQRPKHQRYLSSCSGLSNRSSLRDYLAMERPGLGERMLREVDEDIALDSIANPNLLSAHRASYASTKSSQSERHSYISTVGCFQTARTSNLPFRFSSASESDGTGSILHSPTPANGLRRILNRHSLECELGDLSSISLDISAPGHGTPSRRNSFESHPSSPISELGRMANNSIVSDLPSISLARKSAGLTATTSEAFVKQSTRSSLFSMSSVNSSPCPRPPRRKLLMLTGNRLPRPPPSAPIFEKQLPPCQTLGPPQGKMRPSMSPQQGRVRRLKDTWEAKLSPDKHEEHTCISTSSPRYVRPLPKNLENKTEIVRPRPLSTLALTGDIIPPDTPPPSSPSASEMSFASTSQGSFDQHRSTSLQSRLANFGRRRTRGHKRQSSQLSRHAILAEPIEEEVTVNLQLPPIQQQSPEVQEEKSEQHDEYSDYTQACEFLDSYLQDASPVASPSPKSVSPLVIRKTRSQTSLASVRSLHLGLDAFQTRSQQFGKPKKAGSRSSPDQKTETKLDPVIVVGQEEPHWEDIEAHLQLKWTRFCHDAILELQKSKAMWPDTDVSLDIFESPSGSINSSYGSSIYSSPLIQAFSTPGSGCAPDLTSPTHQSAIVGFLLDSQARYRSEMERFDTSQDVPSTPELSPDRSRTHVLQGRGMSDVLPSPVLLKRLSYKPPQAAKRASYQPKSLMLVQKHLSNNSPVIPSSGIGKVNVDDKAGRGPLEAAKVPLQPKPNQSGLPKSTKGYKPRVPPARSPEKVAVEAVRKAEPLVRPLTPGKRIRAVVRNRTLQVYADEVHNSDSVHSTDAKASPRQKINSFLPGRKLSQRRNEAFTAARRKLEGVGDPGEQTDRSSGLSSSAEMELHKSGLEKFGSNSSSSIINNARQAAMGTVLEAGGSAEIGGGTRHSDLYSIKNRPRPPTRRTAPGLLRTMR